MPPGLILSVKCCWVRGFDTLERSSSHISGLVVWFNRKCLCHKLITLCHFRWRL